MSTRNRKVVLKSEITGIPRADQFRVIDTDIPEPADGEFLVRHIYLSLDPYQRSVISGAYADGTPLTEAQAPGAETVGQIIASRHRGFAAGEYVRHFGGWQEYSICNGERAFKIDPAAAPLSSYIGILGMPGLTAWASIIALADVQPGQSVLVSAASGAVGSMVGQIAMQKGATAYGIAGSDEKCIYVTDVLGFADCINYKQPNYRDALDTRIPLVDIYHDNVGGEMLTNAIGTLRDYGTVILCGLISQYNERSKGEGFNIAPAILKRAVMKGLIVYDFENRRQEFFDLVAPWVTDGSIKFKEDIAAGIESTGAQFEKLMSGRNFGKTLVALGPETTQ